MNPNREQIERWAEDMGDGWTRIPTSAVEGLLWVLGEAEKAEAYLAAERERADQAEKELREARLTYRLAAHRRADRADALADALREAREDVLAIFHAGWDSSRRDACQAALDRIDAALSGAPTNERETGAGTPCGACGGYADVRQRGWTDEGAPMPTCADCGGPASNTASAALREVHEHLCGCDRPGQLGYCVAEPTAAFAIRGASEVEHREGVAEVYGPDGTYMGCIGIERWRQIVEDDSRETTP